MYFGPHSDGMKSGWPLAILVGGLVLPFAARGHYGLVIASERKAPYRWKPPIVIDRLSEDRIAFILTSIAQAARKVGLRVIDERGSY